MFDDIFVATEVNFRPVAPYPLASGGIVIATEIGFVERAVA